MSGAIAETNSALLSFIERASRDQSFNIEKFSELLRLQRDMEADRARRMFNISMSEAQTEMEPIVKDAPNRHLGNKYATLEAIDTGIRPIYTKHGFSVRYGSAPPTIDGGIRITCTIAHKDGYFEESYLDAPISTQGSQGGRMATTGVQAVGSAVTYLRRYLLGMAFNVVVRDEDDDDGEATRAARMAKLAPTYDAPVEPPPSIVPYNPAEGRPVIAPRPTRSQAQWKVWLEKLTTKLAAAQNQQDVADSAGMDTVVEALNTAPKSIVDEINALIKAAYDKHPPEVVEELATEWPGMDDTVSGDWPGPVPT